MKGPKPNKFGDHYSGPHIILEIINKNNIKIQYNKGKKIVHANRLRIPHINYAVKPKNVKNRRDSCKDSATTSYQGQK